MVKNSVSGFYIEPFKVSPKGKTAHFLFLCSFDYLG